MKLKVNMEGSKMFCGDNPFIFIGHVSFWLNQQAFQGIEVFFRFLNYSEKMETELPCVLLSVILESQNGI